MKWQLCVSWSYQQAKGQLLSLAAEAANEFGWKWDQVDLTHFIYSFEILLSHSVIFSNYQITTSASQVRYHDPICKKKHLFA